MTWVPAEVALWELDFWGKYRRATESARAQMAASEWGRRDVTSLVSEVASGYFFLRSLDSQLDISQRTSTSREESPRLTQVREQGGVTSLVDVRQAEQLVFTASGRIVDLQRRIEQQENALSVLLGRNVGPVERGRALTDQPHAPEVPEGLPSTCSIAARTSNRRNSSSFPPTPGSAWRRRPSSRKSR